MKADAHGCGLTKQRNEEMRRFQESAVDEHKPFSSYMKNYQAQHFSLRKEYDFSFPERFEFCCPY